MKVAVIGASGFIGLRLVETLYLAGEHTVLPVVRSFSSLAVLSRFNLDWAVCDPLDQESLAASLKDCEIVVHAAIGDPAQIVSMAETIYRAADKAKVRRLVVLSSASVHGQAPEQGTDERSPLHTHHSLVYNNAKVKAEQVLQRLRNSGNVELVLLRPGVVYGPRSRWIYDLARQIHSETAYLINDGEGICNSIYVDNLIEAVRLSMESSSGDGEAFLIGDEETVRWIDFYNPLLEACGKSLESIYRVKPPVFKRSFREKFEGVVASKPVQTVLPWVPDRAKRLTKAALSAWEPIQPPNAWSLRQAGHAPITEEIALLQQCSWKFPHDKSNDILGYKPKINFDTGMGRSVKWLDFISPAF